MGLLAIACGYTFASAKQPQRYRIESLNTKNILIGNQRLKKGDTFMDTTTIHWISDSRQQMIVVKVGDVNGKEIKVTRHGFVKYEKYGVRNLFDFLTQENYLGTRDVISSAKHYSEIDHYLTDTLMMPASTVAYPPLRAEAVWEYHGEEVVTPLKLSHDGRFYIITTKIYGKYKPCDIKLNIREINDELEWSNYVYQNLPIIYIPKKL